MSLAIRWYFYRSYASHFSHPPKQCQRGVQQYKNLYQNKQIFKPPQRQWRKHKT